MDQTNHWDLKGTEEGEMLALSTGFHWKQVIPCSLTDVRVST